MPFRGKPFDRASFTVVVLEADCCEPTLSIKRHYSNNYSSYVAVLCHTDVSVTRESLTFRAEVWRSSVVSTR